MALWQFKVFLVQRGKVIEGSLGYNKPTVEEFDTMLHWKRSDFDMTELSGISKELRPLKSWSDKIAQFGDLESHCLEFLVDKDEIREISFRVDVRKDYNHVVNRFIALAERHDFILVDEAFNAFPVFEFKDRVSAYAKKYQITSENLRKNQ